MMRYRVGFAPEGILITHLHADHYLGLPGLLRTLNLQERADPLRLWGPPRSADMLRAICELGADRLAYEVDIRETSPGETAVVGDGYRVLAFRTSHTRTSVGFALVEDERLGRFDVERARELGVPPGPLFGRLHRGEAVELPDGRRVDPAGLAGPPRPGRKVVYTGDTRPAPETIEAARGADLLVHEATFAAADSRRARETGHSTAAQAAQVALEAGVRRLVLTHISARYAQQPGILLREARAIFPRTDIARDGWSAEVPFDDRSDSDEEDETT